MNKFYLNGTSPFSRLVLVVSIEYKLEKLELIWSDPWSFEEKLQKVNPFSMIPTFQDENGYSVYDSLLIIDYLLKDYEKDDYMKDYHLLSFSKILIETTFRHFSLNKYSTTLEKHPFIERTNKMLQDSILCLNTYDLSKYEEKSIEILQLMVTLDYIGFRIPHIFNKLKEHVKEILLEYKKRDSFKKTSLEVLARKPQFLEY